MTVKGLRIILHYTFLQITDQSQTKKWYYAASVFHFTNNNMRSVSRSGPTGKWPWKIKFKILKHVDIVIFARVVCEINHLALCWSATIAPGASHNFFLLSCLISLFALYSPPYFHQCEVICERTWLHKVRNEFIKVGCWTLCSTDGFVQIQFINGGMLCNTYVFCFFGVIFFF